MNEKIKVLAEQAGFIDRGTNHTAYMSFDHEKFSELIVKECYHVVVSNPHIGTSLAGANMIKHFEIKHFELDNIEAAESIHSDKGYSLGTPEAQEAFESKRGYTL